MSGVSTLISSSIRPLGGCWTSSRPNQKERYVPLFDLPPEQLRRHVTEIAEPLDIDAFWARTLAENSHGVEVSFQAATSILTTIETLDVSFRGYHGDEIRGWLHLPANR